MKINLTPLDQVQDKYFFPVTPLIDSPSKDISKTLPRLIIPDDIDSIIPHADEPNNSKTFELPVDSSLIYSRSHPTTPKELPGDSSSRRIDLSLLSSEQDSPIYTKLKLTFPADLWGDQCESELSGKDSLSFEM
jgi:hypothetical protein